MDYGYDIHSITMSGRTYGRILAGARVRIHGQGFSWEGVPDPDYWEFNVEGPASVSVRTEGGGDIYTGEVDDVAVLIDGVSITRHEPVPVG